MKCFDVYVKEMVYWLLKLSIPLNFISKKICVYYKYCKNKPVNDTLVTDK